LEKLISDNLNEALCEQIGQEKYNSNLYLYIAGYLKNKGLDGLAKHFEGQHQEEIDHSKKIFDFLTDHSSPIFIPEINSPNIPLVSIVQIAELYLTREIDTTKSLNGIKHLAIDEDNPTAEEFMRDMIKMQIHEYEEATTFLDKAILAGDDWKIILLWDASLK
jgi:ferritin